MIDTAIGEIYTNSRANGSIPIEQCSGQHYNPTIFAR